MRHSKTQFDYKGFLQKNIAGIVVIVVVCTLIGAFKINILPQNLAMGETIPFFQPKKIEDNSAFKPAEVQPQEKETFFISTDSVLPDNQRVQEGEENDFQPKITELIGVDDISYQPETDHTQSMPAVKEVLTADDIEKMKSVEYLKKTFYIVDKRTDLVEGDIDPQAFLQQDLTIDNTIPGPKVLIFHTHSTEGFSDSDMSKDMAEGIWGVGERLKEILENEYGIETLHDTGRYDIVNGKGQIIGAYERMEPPIRKLLAQYPSIQVVIDMHRDGVPDTVRLVKNINGKDCAQVMFFNGLCKLNKNGSLNPIAGLENPYVKDNLALSFNMQVTANTLFPSFTRRVYLNAYRYSLHMIPKSLLIEVGAQTNTKEEAKNAMEPLAQTLAQVLLKK